MPQGPSPRGSEPRKEQEVKSSIAKHRTTGELYSVEYVVHSVNQVDGEDVFACYKLSAYDGMPIGSLVHIPKSELDLGNKEYKS